MPTSRTSIEPSSRPTITPLRTALRIISYGSMAGIGKPPGPYSSARVALRRLRRRLGRGARSIHLASLSCQAFIAHPDGDPPSTTATRRERSTGPRAGSHQPLRAVQVSRVRRHSPVIRWHREKSADWWPLSGARTKPGLAGSSPRRLRFAGRALLGHTGGRLFARRPRAAHGAAPRQRRGADRHGCVAVAGVVAVAGSRAGAVGAGQGEHELLDLRQKAHMPVGVVAVERGGVHLFSDRVLAA